MEAGGHIGVVDTGEKDQKVVTRAAPMVITIRESRQGLKRSRRDRGSTAKERISKMPPCAAGKRSSIYRGVTRHRWTGRYEAHLWDKSTWNQSQNKKGKQVYLGAYDEEEPAARAYDLAALRYWGLGTLINFPLSDYARDVEEMQNVTREEYLASLRRKKMPQLKRRFSVINFRKSSGFSRGVSKYRGVARHHHNGRWEARIGRVFGNKYLYLGTYSTQEEAAVAYDMAAIEYRGLNAITNFDLSRYIRWLRPGRNCPAFPESDTPLSLTEAATGGDNSHVTKDANGSQGKRQQLPVFPTGSSGPFYRGLGPVSTQEHSSGSPTALSLLLQSPVFIQMLERTAAAPTQNESDCADPSEVTNLTEEQQQEHHHSQQQHLNDINPLYPVWSKEVGHQQNPLPSLVEHRGSVDQKYDRSSHPSQLSATSNLESNYQIVVGLHHTELEDRKQQNAQRYKDFHCQQHQDNFAVAAYGGYSGSHDSVSTIYTNQESGAVSGSLEDGRLSQVCFLCPILS